MERQKKNANAKLVGASLLVLAVAAGLAVALTFWKTYAPGGGQPRSLFSHHRITLGMILTNTQALARADIAQVNMACASGLSGTDLLDGQNAQAILDTWASRVRSETEKYHYQFHQHPESFNHSEAYFKVMTVITVLQQDFGVRYTPSHAASSTGPESNDAFFADASDVFLHGILSLKHQGTCSSMPVLYAAVGRRLGYPLKLVTTRGHLFCRWEDAKERFNIEATNEGLNCFPDEYYKHWPFELSSLEINSGRYLRSLTPREELALFLQTRGMCLKAAGRLAEAREAWEKAKQLAPDWEEHEMLIASVSHK